MTTFADIKPGQLRTDCRFYTGYKPCHKFDGCPDCPHFEDRGSQALLVAGREDTLEWLGRKAAARRAEGHGWVIALVPPDELPNKEIQQQLGLDEVHPLDSRGALAVSGRTIKTCMLQDPFEDLDPFLQTFLRDYTGESSPNTEPEIEGRILIIKLGAMGDVLRTKVILPELRRLYPEWKITWLTEPVSLFLLDDGAIDEALPWEPEALEHILSRSYEHVYCLDKDPHALALSRRVHANRRFGFKPTDHNTVTVWNSKAIYALRLGLSDPLKFHENTKSAQQIVADTCEVRCSDDQPYRLRISPQVRGKVAPRLRAIRGSLPRGTRLVGLNTGCGPVFATKAWPTDHLKEFIQLAIQRHDMAIMLLGGPREKDLHEELMGSAGGQAGRRVFDSGTDNPLMEFFALVEGCDAIASSDSLAMHVAIALQVPVVVWFGPTCHQEVDLYGRGEKLVTDFPCSPCYLKTCPKPVFCLSELSPKDVLDALDRVLDPEIFS